MATERGQISMDGLLVILALVVLAIPVAVIVLLIGQSRLKSRVRQLEDRVAVLTLAPQAEPALPQPAVVAEVEAPGAPIAEVPLTAEPEPTPAFAAYTETPVTPETTLQDGPIVLRADRATALAGWLQRNWIYVVSAMSLALAGVFLVQYSVQNGLLPPWARVAAAYVLGAALVAAGEWIRRRDGDGEGSDTAYLPSVFAGAGVVILFAAAIAARQLYGLIGPELTFVLLLLTAAIAVGLGWFYGPLLVAIGLIGATAAPFLVGSDADPMPLLYAYYALIAATGLAVDAIRRWAWVSVLALVLGYFGGTMMLAGQAGEGPWLVFLLIMPVAAIALPLLGVVPRHDGPSILIAALARGKSGWPPFPVRLAGGTVLISSLAMMMLQGQTPLIGLLAFAALMLLAVTLLIWAEPAEGLADLALIPSLAFIARLVLEPLNFWPLAANFLTNAVDQRPPETSGPMTATWLVVMATLITAAFTYRSFRGGTLSLIHGLAAVLMAPVALAVMELYWQPGLTISPWNWALHAIVLAAAMTALATRYASTDGTDLRRMAYATLSALSLIALALFILTSTTALTLALGVLAITAAWLDRRFVLREMGLFIQVAVCVISYRLLIDPGLDWALDAPLVPVLAAFAGSIAAEVAALALLRNRGRAMTSGVLESAAMALTAVLANVLLSRWLVPLFSFTGPSAADLNYAATLNAMPWLILMLTQLYRAQLGASLRRLRYVLAVIAGLIAAGGLFAAAIPLNPLFAYYADGYGAKIIGPLVFDTLALSYAMPGLILLIAAWRLPFPRLLRIGFLAVGAALLALYIGLEIRRYWQGDWIGGSGVLQYELYSYTIAMMLVGAALLYQAIARHSVTLRRIGMAVIALTIAKVFLLDASGLTGLTRVFSFLGLGLSLAGLAWLNRWAGKVSTE
ncbi:MAG: DUF2339 domain-containing protein [bacterium]